MNPGDSKGSGGLTRRDLFRRGGAAAAGTAVALGGSSAIAPRYSPVGRAAAIAPAIPIGIAAGAAGLAYLSGTKYWPGDDRDYSGYTGADALWLEIYKGTVEMQSADERVMTSIENNIQHSQNIALSMGKKAIIEKMNAEATESEAQSAMESAINDYYSTIQRNLITHWNSQIEQIDHMWGQAVNHDNLSYDSVFTTNFDHANMSSPIIERPTLDDVSVTLLNGETVQNVNTAYLKETDGVGGGTNHHPFESVEAYYSYEVNNPDGTEATYVPQTSRLRDAWTSITTERDQVLGDLSGFVSDVYTQWSAGDIPTEDLVDPITAATELRQNYDNRAGQSAHAAMLGIPTTADLSADLEIQSDEAEDGVWEVTADIFTSYVPTVDVSGSASISSGVLTLSTEPVADSEYELTTSDSETVTFYDSELSDNGDGTWQIDLSSDLSTTSTSVDTLLEEDGFKSGNTYDPSGWSEPFYIAYNYVDQSGEERGDFTQIESQFTIVEVTDTDGNSVDSFRTESRNNQTADVSALKEELEQLREEQIRLQEEAQEETDGGGGPLFGGIGGGGGAVAGIAVVGTVILLITQAVRR